MNRVKIAFARGYRATDDGKIIGLRGRELSLNLDRHGYLRFTITGGITVYAHRLVAYQKYSDALFEKSAVVRHLDGNSRNNSSKNIGIGTARDNAMDVPKKTRQRVATYAGRTRSSLTKADVQEIRRLRENEKLSYAQILALYPIAKSTLSYIVNYQTWKDV